MAATRLTGDADPVGKTLTTVRGGCNGDTVCANQTVPISNVGSKSSVFRHCAIAVSN